MIALENILSQEIVQRLGWTLLHFIWQAAVVALLLAILLRVLRKSTANLRYIIACLALATIVLLPVITIRLVPVSAPHIATHIEPAPAPAVLSIEEMPPAETIVLEEPMQPESVALVSTNSWKQRAVDTLEPALPYIVSGWLLGVFGLSLWHLGGWTQLQRLKRRMVKQVDDTLHSKLKVLAQRLRVKQTVQLMESALVQIPTVVGWLRPVILLPASALTGLTSEQLGSILAHELAHIKRFDYLLNILQTVVEILGFYHPAVWWVSHKIRAERENCCDDLAVSISGDRVCYAGALASMEEIRAGRGQLAVAATGGILFKRICRLVGKDSAEKPGFSWIPAVTAILLILALVIPTALALTIKSESQEGQKPVEPQLIKLNTLPDVWKINYHSGMWPSGMARDLVQLRAVPTPAYEYDESWKEERLEFRIRSLKDERIGSILFWGERRQFDRITLSPGKYLLSYTRERTDPKTSCLIKMNRVEFPVDLSRRGAYTLVFSPKLEPLKTTDNKFLPTTCTGRVLDSKGEPLTSAQVAAYELYFDMAGNLKLRLIGEIVTKADGNFLFETTPSVRKNRSMGAEVVARKEGLAVGWALWPLYGNQKAAITLQEPTKLSGRIVDENGAPIPNANVRAVLFKKKTFREEKTMWLAGIQPFNWLSVRTDKNGRFEFNNIPENSAGDLLVTASGFGTIYTRKPDRIDKGYELAEFVAGQTDIKITMPIEARIEGKVLNKRTGDGIAGVTLRVIPHFTTIFFERYLCTTKEDGTFNISGLRSGKYMIRRAVARTPTVDVVAESGKTTRNVILEIPYEVRNPGPAQSGIVTPNENEQESDSQVEDDLLIATEQDKKSSADNIPVPVPAKSPAPSAQDKTIIQVDCLIVEVYLDSKMDRETTIIAENLLGNKISLRDTKADVSLRKAAKATAAIKDKSAENKRVTQDQFKALVDMLTSKGYLRILMNPRIQVVDGKTAKIISTQKISSTQESIEDSIQITPHVFADGHIILQVEATINSRSIPKGVEQIPIITTREVSTRVTTSPGESLMIIGGLKETEKSTKPNSNVKDSEKQTTELLLILTPTIVTSTTDSQEKTDVRIKGKSTESVDKLKRLGLAVIMYADEHDNKLPETLQALKPYIDSEKNYFWLLNNVEYLGKNKNYQPNQPQTPVAYDKTQIDEQYGTDVLFLDGHVEFAPLAKLKELLDVEKRFESARKLSNLGKALLIYANDHEDKYPDSLWGLLEYLNEEDFNWALVNVEYLTKEKTIAVRPDTVIAYDKKLLAEKIGTNVLFNDSHVEFVKPERLKKLGISKVATAVIKPDIFVEPNEPMESVNLKNAEMITIIEKLSEWTGKVIIPTAELLKQKITITIYAPEKLPRSKAIEMVYNVLRLKGYTAKQIDDAIVIKPTAEAKPGEVPTISDDEPFTMIENKDQIVTKIFKLKNHSPSQMAQIVRPLLSHTGHVSADERTGSLLVTDTVENLMRIEKIIEQFDVAKAEQTVTEIFEIRYGDPAEIVQFLRKLITDQPGFGAIIGPGKQPIVLIPEPRYKWIIAKASAEDMKQIGEWIEKLDREERVPASLEQMRQQIIKQRKILKMRQDCINNDPVVKALSENVANAEKELIVARQKLADSHPEVRQKAEYLQALKKHLDERIKAAGKSFDDMMWPEPNLPPAPEVPLITNTWLESDMLEVLHDIASMAGIPIIPDETVVGLLTAELKDVPLDTALDIVLVGTPYVVKKTPYYYLVSSALEPLERVDSAKKLSNLGKALLIYANDHEDKYPDSLHHLSEYLNVEELKWVLANIEYLAHGKTIAVRPDAVIAYDKMLPAERKGTNVLFNDSHVEFVKPERLKELGISANAIQIETRLLFVSEDFLKDIGLDANSMSSSDAWSEHLAADPAAEPNSETYSLILDDLHISFLHKAVQAHKGTKALTAPRATVHEGKTAEIKIMTEYPVLDYNEPNDPSDEPQPKTDYVEIGTHIWLKPELTPDNQNVNLYFKLEMSQLKGIIEGKYQGKYPYHKPIVDVISTETRTVVPNGKTLLIGGLKINEKEKEPRAPRLKDLPLIGGIFSSNDKIKDHKMLLILVKTIITPQQKARKILRGQEDSEEHIKSLANQLEKKLKHTK